ncbi:MULTISPECIES: SMI1/KNR4 family protein [Paenibacillus]|uniref:SMI1/KNR4 family protein n=1 Tax=Paenibacillus TaxID=44249 RepID=UPI0011AA2429|nr:SMI1/KNR4 family protein [Paenibacillus xylanexedens]
MWKEHLHSISKEYTFSPPASGDDIAKVEDSLQVTLPRELKEILLETNGVRAIYDLGLIWSVDRIKNENKHYRDDHFQEYYMPFDNLIFFGESGIGDLFAFPVTGDGTCRDDVFVWNHENDSRKWVAPSVSKYLEWTLEGKIKI